MLLGVIPAFFQGDLRHLGGNIEGYQQFLLKGTDQAGTFISLKCVVYYANYRSGHQSSKIQVVP